MELEVEKDRAERESESSDDRICCGAEDRALVDNWETMEPELETDDNNPEPESEMPGDGVCRQVRKSSEDSEASISESESNSDKWETDWEYSGYEVYYRVEYGALLDSCFRSQKWLSMETAVEYKVQKVEGLPPSQVEIISWMQSGSPK